jgi:hypothetical protein
MTLFNRFEAAGEQDMGNSVTLEWVDAGRIVVFRLKNGNRDSVDRWFDVVSQVFAEFPVDEPLIVMHDVRDAGLGAYMREKSTQLTPKAAHFSKGRYAVVIADNTLSHLVRLFLNVTSRRLTTRERRAFTNFDAAVQWLRQDQS